MPSRRKKSSGVIGAYQKYKADARGWGVPTFAAFRERLWPLRNEQDKSRWPDDDMVYVMELQDEGAGYALQRFFTTGGRTNPVAVEVFGSDPLRPEGMSKDELDAHMHALVRDCKDNKWSPREFLAYIHYLDSSKTPADLERAKQDSNPLGASGGAPVGEAADAPPERDLFAEAYRAAGAGYKRRVREALAAGAGK
jgi:hypothetical protein